MGALMSTDRRHVSWLLWLWWVAAGAIGGGVGGTLAAPLLTIGDSDWILAANSYVYLIVAGVVTGVLQWLLLRRYIRGAGWWVLATVIGWQAGFAAVGAIGLFIILDLDVYGVPTAGLSGLQFGAVVGLAQWLVLRRQVAREGWWILVGAIGWTMSFLVARDVGAALGGIATGALGGTLGALVVVGVVRQRLSHSGLWVLAAVVAWAVAWIAALVGSDASLQMGQDALSGTTFGAALSALPGVALVWLLRRPITIDPVVPPFEWRFWSRWVLGSAGSAAIFGGVLGAAVSAMREAPELDNLVEQVDFFFIRFTAIGVAVGIIQWPLLRRRIPLAWMWGLGSAFSLSILGLLWGTAEESSGLALLLGGLVGGTIQWIPLRRRITWASRWIVVSALGVVVASPLAMLVASLISTLATKGGATIVSYAAFGAIAAAGITSVTGMALIWLLQEPRPTPGEQERA